jgi:ABC-type antimicrobial peptide transport system permease subunit
MLSLSVSERTREIRIRTALGAQRSAVVLTILKRSLVQIGLGAIIGLPVAARVVHLTIGSTTGQSPVMSMLLAAGMAVSLVLIIGVIFARFRHADSRGGAGAMRSDG